MTTIYIDKDFKFSRPFEKGLVASIGFFDGVHRGHRFLIDQIKLIAQASGLPSAIITFPLHPRKVLQTNYQPELLNDFGEKIFQLSTTGIDYCFVIDFTKELSELTAKEFIQERLHEKLNVRKLIIGYDHKFGKGLTTDFDDYKVYGEECGMKVIKALQLQEEEVHVSSTSVRRLLAEGNVKRAAEILGYNYTLEGTVISGNKMGREMGFPTANITIAEAGKVIPSNGIYATWVHVNDQIYRGMTYVGYRPTLLTDGELRIETNLLDFSGNLYGKSLKLDFVEYIRSDIQFKDIEDLMKQLQNDKERTMQILK